MTSLGTRHRPIVPPLYRPEPASDPCSPPLLQRIPIQTENPALLALHGLPLKTSTSRRPGWSFLPPTPLPPVLGLRLFSPFPPLLIRLPVLSHRARVGRIGSLQQPPPLLNPPIPSTLSSLPPLPPRRPEHPLSTAINSASESRILPSPKRPGVCCADVRDEDRLSSCPGNHPLQHPQRPLPPPYRLPPLRLHGHQLAFQRSETRFLQGAAVGGGEVRDQDVDLVRFVEEVGCQFLLGECEGGGLGRGGVGRGMGGGIERRGGVGGVGVGEWRWRGGAGGAMGEWGGGGVVEGVG